MSKLYKQAFVELSNLRRKFAMSTNIDSLFSDCVLSEQNSVSVEDVLEFLVSEKFRFGSQKLPLTPLCLLS